MTEYLNTNPALGAAFLSLVVIGAMWGVIIAVRYLVSFHTPPPRRGFPYKSKVRVVGGFFKDHTGTIQSPPDSGRQIVSIESGGSEWIPIRNLKAYGEWRKEEAERKVI